MVEYDPNYLGESENITEEPEEDEGWGGSEDS